jgi:flagellar protein FliO/FliZ
MDIITALFKMISALAIVLGLMALTAYGVRRFLGPRIGTPGSGPLMRVQGSISLGVKKEIALVEVAGSFLVVGVTPNQISLLARFEKENLVSPFSHEERGNAVR